MAWGGIKPDTFQRVPGGISIWSYLLKDNGYDVPPMRTGSPEGITITFVPIYQFLYEKQRPSDITSRQIEHLDPKGLIPNYFITFDSIWQVLEDTRCWQKSDGSTNDKTIALAISTADGLLPPMYKEVPIHKAAMLTAYLLKKYKLSVNDIRISKDHPECFQWKDFKQTLIKQYKRL
jgi:hypothetical protein